jgi:hypothetical protein
LRWDKRNNVLKYIFSPERIPGRRREMNDWPGGRLMRQEQKGVKTGGRQGQVDERRAGVKEPVLSLEEMLEILAR